MIAYHRRHRLRTYIEVTNEDTSIEAYVIDIAYKIDKVHYGQEGYSGGLNTLKKCSKVDVACVNLSSVRMAW